MFAVLFATLAITSSLLIASWFKWHSSRPSQRLRYYPLDKSIPRTKASEPESRAHRNDEDGKAKVSRTGQVDLHMLKQIYHQVQNLERFPHVISQARELICSLLNEAMVSMRDSSAQPVVVTLEDFSRSNLQSALLKHDETTARQWNQYLLRRRAGEPRELFRDSIEAQWWLKQMAPVKFVDGAWLGHVNRVTLPYDMSEIVRNAWQVFSEELGDGDRFKNHVYVYSSLLDSFNGGLPPAHDLDFIDDRQGLTEIAVWKSAVVQLLICLFPHELLPEILGFNLHFEAASLETMIAARELKEVGLDPSYFLLHISIDNAQCGHAAMAAESVCRYIERIQALEGIEAACKAWRRVKSGYMLSYTVSPTIDLTARLLVRDREPDVQASLAGDVIRILQSKAPASQIIHCGSQCKIGRRTLAEWISPSILQTQRGQAELLWDLSHSTYWIDRGNGKNSRFLKEMLWGGRMFGCFTDGECTTIQRWIDSLPPNEAISRPEHDILSILRSYPVFEPSPLEEAYTDSVALPTSSQSHDAIEDLNTLVEGHEIVPARLLPLWLTHPCLLQNLVSVPSRAASASNCAILNVIRAQLGFQLDRQCPAGMEEVRTPHSSGVIEVGLALMHAWGYPEASCLEDVLIMCPSQFAVKMLHWAMRPLEYRGYLIGMATAFAKLHDILSRSDAISPIHQAALREIARNEDKGLQVCWDDMKIDGDKFQQCLQGYRVACREIRKCFSPARDSDCKVLDH